MSHSHASHAWRTAHDSRTSHPALFSFLTLLLLGLCAGLALPATAVGQAGGQQEQDKEKDKDKKKDPGQEGNGEEDDNDNANAGKRRELTEDELAARLTAFKDKIARKVIPKRLIEKGERRVNKWLDEFQAVQSKHYIVFTNGPSLTVRRFAKSLEDLYKFVGSRFPMDDVNHLLEAYIFQDEEEYYSFCVDVVGWSRQRAEVTAGHACAKYYATFYQAPKSSAVMHEATHQLVAACMKVRGLGSWFQEGLAVWVEKTILGSKTSATMRTDMRNGDFYHLKEFMEIDSLIADRQHSSRNYDHAGALIDFLVRSRHPKMKGKFHGFLKAARRNYAEGFEVTERLFQKVYGMSVAEVEEAWGKHHRVDKLMTRAEQIEDKKRRRIK